MGHNGKIFKVHNRASGKESEHSIIGKIKSIMCIGLILKVVETSKLIMLQLCPF